MNTSEGNQGWTSAKRLEGKVAVVIGAGQSPGEGVGNGRAAAMRFAREGARVLAVDRRLESAEETAELIRAEGFECVSFAADVTREEDLARAMAEATQKWGSLDVLHNNVGVSIAGGDADLLDITEENFDNVCRINLRGTVFACKHAVAIMRKQGGGAIVNVSSAAAVGKYPYVAYKAAKAGVVAFTEQLALQNAQYGIRANCVLPGLIATPMAVDTRVREWKQSREQVSTERNAKVPLGRQGTGWDVANAALFLASDEANFITGVSMLVDGGRILNRI
ncbi:oxidoreductase (plasmid) [Cupriavidus necator N-1]|uniref:Oxidoreductase n=1 Tax=Cupriavidus necator (strain ATCC 43291 / DSM 13513 / CCUG 52238 / LMG 8453 / N-1) TaxID=1042878 RepID=F8GXF0_CUPNN|nr:SDR family NAD(P)-dependent oxidoreductase [Cupriavidus necator]AEI82020.1 oxidoreductase [Cupriavidus necator N-1]MDX6008338.1 SDR family NAD(P)-dependent oxidoreductase [Cupriavidus necator]